MTSLNLSIAGKVETANTIQNYFQPASTKFITLTNSSPYFAKVEKVIRESLAPFYGNQDSSIEKIKESKDRKSELLLYNDNPVGLIVYKKEKQDAFSIYGIRDSFELKTFLVIDQERNAEKEYDTLLLNRVLKLARGKFATSVHLTAPEQYDAEFFSSKGFSIARTWKDKYIQGVTEHLLYLELPKSDVIKIKESRPEAIEEGKVNKSKRKRSISPQTTQEVQDSKKLRKKRKGPSVKPRKSLHHLTMKKKYIHQMRSGLKTVEGRIFNRSVPKFQCGDKLRFYYLSNASDDLTCKITNIKRFPNFREMLVDSGVKACLPDANNLEEAVLAYDQIPKYKEKAEKFGVAAIHVTPILQ